MPLKSVVRLVPKREKGGGVTVGCPSVTSGWPANHQVLSADLQMTDVMFANVAGGRHGPVRGSPAIKDDTSVVFTPPPPYPPIHMLPESEVFHKQESQDVIHWR